MRICVAGLWHLGSVVSACLASGGHQVTGFDFDHGVVEALSSGKPPILEPGLEELICHGIGEGRLIEETVIARTDLRYYTIGKGAA